MWHPRTWSDIEALKGQAEESSTLDFKKDLGSSSEIAKDLAAMALNGGVLVSRLCQLDLPRRGVFPVAASVGRLPPRPEAQHNVPAREASENKPERADAVPGTQTPAGHLAVADGRLDSVKKIGTIGRMASPGSADNESQWAEREARRLLEPLGARWRHTLGVVQRAHELANVLSPSDSKPLVAAAYLHDVGYAPELAESGFHPLDGARFVRAHGHERLAGLVAYHCSAQAEAGERGLRDELADFTDERSAVSRALTYCDLTTDAEGQRVEPAARLQGIRERYDPDTPEARALERSMPTLLDDVRMVESLLAGDGSAIEAGDRGR